MNLPLFPTNKRGYPLIKSQQQGLRTGQLVTENGGWGAASGALGELCDLFYIPRYGTFHVDDPDDGIGTYLYVHEVHDVANDKIILMPFDSSSLVDKEVFSAWVQLGKPGVEYGDGHALVEWDILNLKRLVDEFGVDIRDRDALAVLMRLEAEA